MCSTLPELVHIASCTPCIPGGKVPGNVRNDTREVLTNKQLRVNFSVSWGSELGAKNGQSSRD